MYKYISDVNLEGLVLNYTTAALQITTYTLRPSNPVDKVIN